MRVIIYGIMTVIMLLAEVIDLCSVDATSAQRCHSKKTSVEFRKVKMKIGGQTLDQNYLESSPTKQPMKFTISKVS